MKVLLTGGSGFIAVHCIDILLERGHDVVTTVRSPEKGQKILDKHPNLPAGRLSYVIVKDIAQPRAFDEAIQSDPPFEAVIHTASPFHFNGGDPETEILDPAIKGTTGILYAIKQKAPAVKVVVITSSFAAILNAKKHPKVYDEDCWNPMTLAEAHANPINTYRASKTFAEQAAWEFMEEQSPSFHLATICPPLVFGPVAPFLGSLRDVNTSNQRFRDLIQGKMRKEIVPTSTITWVDVRDVALAHVRAMEEEGARDKRFLVMAGFFSNKAIADMIRVNFPAMAGRLPPEASFDDMPEQTYKFNNRRSVNVLGLNYRSLESSVVDTVNSMLEIDPSLVR